MPRSGMCEYLSAPRPADRILIGESSPWLAAQAKAGSLPARGRYRTLPLPTWLHRSFLSLVLALLLAASAGAEPQSLPRLKPVEARTLPVSELATRLLGPDWLPGFVQKANSGGIERVLL